MAKIYFFGRLETAVLNGRKYPARNKYFSHISILNIICFAAMYRYRAVVEGIHPRLLREWTIEDENCE